MHVCSQSLWGTVCVKIHYWQAFKRILGICNATLSPDPQVTLVGRLTRVREWSQDPGRAPTCNDCSLPACALLQ